MSTLHPWLYAGMAGGGVSFLFNKLPFLKERFDKLDKEKKQLVMLGWSTAIALIVLVWEATAPDAPPVRSLIETTIASWFSAAVSNQGIHQITPKSDTTKGISTDGDINV
jgi:hypothetical protein